MAKLEQTLNGNFNQLLNKIEQGILNGSMSVSLEEAKKDKQEWEKQEKGEFIIEWEEEKQTEEEEKQFEDSEFIIEW